MGRAHTEEQTLESAWVADVCGRCGAALVLGGYVGHRVRNGRREAICPDCAAASSVSATRPHMAAVETLSPAEEARGRAAA
jgi:hypothetical protein